MRLTIATALFGSAIISQALAQYIDDQVDGIADLCFLHFHQDATVYDGPKSLPPQMVTGVQCTSNTEACQLMREISHTTDMSWSIDVGIDFGLGFGKAASAGLGVGFSHSWGYSDGIATGVQVPCPAGGFTCGLMAIPRVVDIDTVFDTDCKKFKGESAVHIRAPILEGDGKEGTREVVDFRACVMKCENMDACIAVQKQMDESNEGLDWCPSPNVVKNPGGLTDIIDFLNGKEGDGSTSGTDLSTGLSGLPRRAVAFRA